MPAKFYVVGSLHLPSRRLFVLVGDVVEGSVRAGMKFGVKLTPSLSATAKVAKVEFVDVRHLGKSYVGLAVAYNSPEELHFWNGLDISNETIELFETSSPAAV